MLYSCPLRIQGSWLSLIHIWAVPRADTLNVPAVQRRAAQIVQDDLVGLRVGVSNVTVHLVVHRLVGHKAERLQQFVRVAGLAVQLAEVNAAAVYAGRGAGLEAAQRHRCV